MGRFNRGLIALALVFCLGVQALAGGYCPYPCKTYQSYSSYNGWGQACYGCHQQPAYQQSAAKVGWKEGLTKYLQDRGDTDDFIRALDAAGVSGPTRQALLMQYAPGGYGNYSLTANFGTPFTQQGSTLYGYQAATQAYAQQFGNIDTGALLNSALRLGSQAQESAGQAMVDINDTINNVARGQQAVANTVAQGVADAQRAQAQGNADAQRLQAARPDPQPISRTFSFSTVAPVQGSGPGGIVGQSGTQAGTQSPPQQAQQPPPAQSLPTPAVILNAKCVSCHNPAKASGNLDLTLPNALVLDQLRKVRERVTATDPARRMPPPSAAPLTPIEAAVIKQAVDMIEQQSPPAGQQPPKQQPVPPAKK